jgi:hypothetical protein
VPHVPDVAHDPDLSVPSLGRRPVAATKLVPSGGVPAAVAQQQQAAAALTLGATGQVQPLGMRKAAARGNQLIAELTADWNSVDFAEVRCRFAGTYHARGEGRCITTGFLTCAREKTCVTCLHYCCPVCHQLPLCGLDLLVAVAASAAQPKAVLDRFALHDHVWPRCWSEVVKNAGAAGAVLPD